MKKTSAYSVAGVLAAGLYGVPACAAELPETVLDPVTVTAAREAQPRAETPSTVDRIDSRTIDGGEFTHPSQLLDQVPGVWVNVTGGEGHMTSIRQPLTTNPVYLYLEDGIPVRSTGFFNHNALYEIDIPQASAIEVSKGPGSALYGSDAIGGIVNVLTRRPPSKPEADVSLDLGQFGWRRLMAGGGSTVGDDGYRGDLNLTHTDGWRDGTGYDRQSVVARWDHVQGDDGFFKTVMDYSHIDQQTAGTSLLSEADYQDHPTRNYTPISFRKVTAFRLSTAYEWERGNTLVSITPYFRYDDMDLLPNWSLTYDPTSYNTRNYSLGLLVKYRRDFAPLRARLIAGVDLDYSPGSHFERSINTAKSGNVFVAYSTGQTIYDYDVTFHGASPYVQAEVSPIDRLRITGGLRYDRLGYDYANNLSDATIVLRPTNIGYNLVYRHPGDTRIDYGHWSPKLGATYAFSNSLNGFVNYASAFRVPSESQLFRQGSALDTVNLKPVKAESYEVGLRGTAGKAVSYEISVYRMTKRDDILSYKDPVTGATLAMNNGKTLHRGVEIGATAALADRWRLGVSYAYAKHTYEDWVVSGAADYSGKEMEIAPRVMANTRLIYDAAWLHGGTATLEWVHLGAYWMDAANAHRYPGHDLLNLRVSYHQGKALEIFGAVMNLADVRYAESVSYTLSQGEQFAPGMPRTVYLGLRYRWGI